MKILLTSPETAPQTAMESRHRIVVPFAKYNKRIVLYIAMSLASFLRPRALHHVRVCMSTIHTPSRWDPITKHIRTVTTIPSCPPSTCSCQDMPSDLDIDHSKPLDGTMAAYHEHVMIPTGRTDWASRIEEDPKLPFITHLKETLGQKGKYGNPFHNVMVTTSSSPSVFPDSAILFPSFKQVHSISTSDESIVNFIEGVVLPERLHPQTETMAEGATEHLKRKPELAEQLKMSDVTDVHVLICGHGQRDSRCGILGPILQKEFEDKLRSSKYRLKEPSQASVNHTRGDEATMTESEVSQISHIGGHKYAGNVIVYVPPVLKDHPLAGHGVWYGRVEPKHVEGIVKKTIEEGVVIKDLFRGGIDRKANLMRV